MNILKDIGKWIKCILIAFVVWFVAFLICQGVAEVYKSTDGLILARDLVSFKIAPYIFAAVGLFIALKIEYEH